MSAHRPPLLNVWDYERAFEQTLDAGAFGYFTGGADDEVTLRDNVAAFRRLRLRPRMLVDVSTCSIETTVLGTRLSMPLLVAPVAFQRMAHPDGEPGMARAAAAAGTAMVLSTLATATPTEVAAAAPDAPRWFQVYVFRDPGVTRALIDEAADAIVSNHGGRQLDGVPATIDALPEVVEAVDGRVEVLVDGGVRRGADVVRALALGARAVLAGRAPLWGLAARGEQGAREVLELLREEIELALVLTGCPSPESVTPDHVRRA